MKNILLAFILLLMTGCNGLLVDDNPSNNAVENFELLWKELDEHYCYFDEKQIDWQVMHTKYRAQIDNKMSDEELFAVLSALLAELKDAHVNLIAPFNTFSYKDWYFDYPPNFNATNVDRHYLGKDCISTAGIKAKQIGDVGYIYYSSFMSPTDNKGLDYILNSFASCKGIVLDIRNNGGGLVTVMYDLASRFTNEEVHVGYSKYKSGKGHADFTKLFYEKVKPSDRVRFTKPIVLLTNRSSYSAANIFPGMMKNFPNVTQVGDTTGGGSASPASFTLINGWHIRYSSISFMDINKKTLEFGVAPDVYVALKKEDENEGKDTLIDEAIRLLNK